MHQITDNIAILALLYNINTFLTNKLEIRHLVIGTKSLSARTLCNYVIYEENPPPNSGGPCKNLTLPLKTYSQPLPEDLESLFHRRNCPFLTLALDYDRGFNQNQQDTFILDSTAVLKESSYQRYLA
jgi:hypothetical protein